jgi:hypothetical protein
MKEVMIYKQNVLTGDWLCFIPETPHAYYYSTKQSAKEFCDKVNEAFEQKKLYFDEEGKLKEHV